MEKLSIKNVPFSIFGSYLVAERKEKYLEIMNLHGWRGQCTMFKIECKEEDINYIPGSLSFANKDGEHQIAFYGKDNCILRGMGKLNLQYVNKKDYPYYMGNPYDAAHGMNCNGKVFINDIKNRNHIWIDSTKGSAILHEVWGLDVVVDESMGVEILPDSTGFYEVKIITENILGNLDYPYDDMNFDRAAKDSFEEFGAWVEAYKDINPNIYATYCLWSNFVGQAGILKSEALLASKAGMCAVWSWDNCFNALGLAKRFPSLAYNQFIMPYLDLAPNGYMWDSIIDERIDWLFTKPPVQGFIYKLMMQENDYFCEPERIKEVMAPMIANTKWWLNSRGAEPCYIHGNDSGIDNATCFDACRYVATPELYGLLSSQCTVISELAVILQQKDLSQEYNALAIKLAAKVDEFIINDQFSVKSIESAEFLVGESILLYRALLAGDKLSDKAREFMIKKINKFAGEYGYASEPLASPLYKTDGYWRGPAWAPDQVMMYVMLKELGQNDFACDMAKKYIKGLEKALFYENIDAITAKGNRCRSYSWTAAAYMYLKGMIQK